MSEHIVHPRVYVAIFLALMLGTGLTVVAAFRDFPGPLNAVVALTIAVVKATVNIGSPIWTYDMPASFVVGPPSAQSPGASFVPFP
jgi:hypothetical protein